MRCRGGWVHAAGFDFLLLVDLLEVSLDDAAGLLVEPELPELELDPLSERGLEYRSPYHPPPLS